MSNDMNVDLIMNYFDARAATTKKLLNDATESKNRKWRTEIVDDESLIGINTK